MDLAPVFKSIVDQDTASVVICDPEHKIIYMNPADVASNADRGGAALIGRSIMDCHNSNSNQHIVQVVDWFKADKSHNRVFIAHRPDKNRDQYMVALRDDDGALVGYYEKHEYRTAEAGPLYDLHD